MGQEIVHCAVCGLRLRSVDFDRGEALRVDHTAYCKACAPAGASSSARMPAADSTRRRKSGSTERIPIVTPRRHSDAVPPSSPPAVLIWGGAGLALAVVAALVFLATKPREQRIDPAPVVVTPEAPVRPEPPRPGTTTIKETAKPVSTEPEELALIDAKLSAAIAKERFRDAFNLLAGAKSTHDTLEWTSAMQTRSRDLEKKVRDLHADLKEKAEQAQKRGAEDEAKRLLDRISAWDLPDYGVESVKAPTPAPVPAPAPSPLPAPAPAPGAAAPAAADKPAVIPFSPGFLKWTLLAPKRMTAASGSPLTLLEDGSILAGGPTPAQEKYSIVLQTELKGITAFRLEALPDRSFPYSGPGRASNGNFALGEFRVQVLADPGADSGTPLTIDRSNADFAQEGCPVSSAHDGKIETIWAIRPAVGKAHDAVFELRTPIAAGPVTLLIVLDQQTIYEQHSIGRFRLSACTAKNAGSEIYLRPPPVIDPARVDQAIQKGVAWLRKPTYPADYGWSANELILWTWVHAGMAESDPDFQFRLKQMLESPLDKTYRVALQAMILEELDRVAYQPRIWQCAQFLVDNQCVNGQWLYGTPTELPKGVPSAGKTPVATAAKLDPEGRRIKPKVVRKLAARKTRDGPPEGDNSNSQYAALGLRACFDAGIQIPEETVHKAMKWWLESQYFDERKEGEYAAKGWSYYSPAKEARAAHAMTAGAISSLAIYDYMLGKDWKQRTPTKAGLNWLAQFFTLNAGYYYLYGLERAAVLYGTEKIGRYPWYPLGAQWILDHQEESGVWITSWSTDKPDEYVWNTWNTCFAILYLKRATRPLVASEDSKK